MSKREISRLSVLRRVEQGRTSRAAAAGMLKLSTRQVRRLLARLESEGATGLVHGGRGRRSEHRTAQAVRKRVVVLRQGRYEGFNDRHFAEKLRECEGIELGREAVRKILREAARKILREAVRKILREAGIGSSRKGVRRKHRARRERRAREGEMLLWDGSRHAWLEERGPMMTLMAAVDDATGAIMPGARFYMQEGSEGYLRIVYEVAKRHGLCESFYGDKHGALRRNDDHWTLEEELRGEQDLTQVGRALRALCIERIDAHSPQAKGRIERPWGTLQDRLVSELRLRRVSTIEGANEVLPTIVEHYNKHFAKRPREARPAWREVPKSLDLARVCALRYEATVRNDNTVRRGGVVIDIPPGPRARSYAKAKIELAQLLDGTYRVYLGDELLASLANPLAVAELSAPKKKKRPAASRAFRKAVLAA